MTCEQVGSFERALFMVHSEIQAGTGKRSFRVNAVSIFLNFS